MEFLWDLLGAYVLAGICHYVRLLRAARRVLGKEGLIMRGGLLRAGPLLFLGIVLSWPVHNARSFRRGSPRRFFAESLIFGGALAASLLAA